MTGLLAQAPMKSPPASPGRTRRARRPGLVEVCDRLGEHAGPERGELTGSNPVDRGKKSSKIHLITERTGLPLSIGISAANTHDSQGLEPLVRGIPPIRSRRGPRRRRPAKPHADKGYVDHRGSGSTPGTSRRASPARASSPPSGWAAIAGRRSARWRGCPGADACTVATSARPSTSSPSRGSPPPRSATAGWQPDKPPLPPAHPPTRGRPGGRAGTECQSGRGARLRRAPADGRPSVPRLNLVYGRTLRTLRSRTC